MFNTGTAWYQVQNFLTTGNPNCVGPGPCISIDPSQEPDRTGHNYYDNYAPYDLRSAAVFGELYWQMTDTFKWTLGLRYTDDKKEVQNHEVSLGKPGFGVMGPPGDSDPILKVQFKETTGRFGFDWKPDLGFTDDSLIYAFFSRGYKAGGLNPACSAVVSCPPESFEPEFVNAIEIGMKNTLLNGRMTLNGTFFNYDYEGYQVSKIVNRTSINENIDAKIHGVEVESVWQPLDGLRLNAAIGWLETKIDGGTSIDIFNRTQSDPGLVAVKSSEASACVVSMAAAQTALTISNSLNNPFALLSVCTPASTAGAGTVFNGATAVGTNAFGGLVSDGVPVDLDGNELPNAPNWTISLGAEYTWQFGGDWAATLRGDYYKQTKTFARIYNSEPDRINSWDNVNLTLTIVNSRLGWEIGAYVKNATDEEAITDFYLTDDSSGRFRNTFYTEPRTYGVSLQKRF